MRTKIRLDTITDIGNFVVAVAHATNKGDQVWVKDGKGSCVSALSFLGLAATRDFEELWCESEKDIYSSIKQFEVV